MINVVQIKLNSFYIKFWVLKLYNSVSNIKIAEDKNELET